MTNEEAIKRAVRQKTAIEDLIRAQTTSSVVRATYSDELEFINAALKALRRRKRSETAKRIPLTILQLCNMCGERVRLADLDAETEKTVTLGRCEFVTQDGDIPRVVGVYYSADEEKSCFASFKYYKRSWLAYAYPPTHIDRETWEAAEKERDEARQDCAVAERNHMLEVERRKAAEARADKAERERDEATTLLNYIYYQECAVPNEESWIKDVIARWRGEKEEQ